MNLCLKCHRRLRTCLCADLKPFATLSRFIILMHPMEYKKEKLGTARFTHLILQNSEILVGINFDGDEKFQKILNDPTYDTYVLYPGEKATSLSGEVAFPDSRPKQFIVIDGTWPCAKKMMKLSTILHTLPRVSFTTDRVSNFRIKQQPGKSCLSTVESIHQVLKDLNRLGIECTEGKEENLMDVFQKTVDLQIAIAKGPITVGYRRRPYREPSERKASRKWESRLLFFKDGE
jgi:DTW domain-containing protein